MLDTYTLDELEALADQLKVLVVKNLCLDGLLDKDAAEKWCTNHTPITRKKSFFRTITNKWRDEEEKADQRYWLIVSRLEEPSERMGG